MYSPHRRRKTDVLFFLYLHFLTWSWITDLVFGCSTLPYPHASLQFIEYPSISSEPPIHWASVGIPHWVLDVDCTFLPVIIDFFHSLFLRNLHLVGSLFSPSVSTPLYLIHYSSTFLLYGSIPLFY